MILSGKWREGREDRKWGWGACQGVMPRWLVLKLSEEGREDFGGVGMGVGGRWLVAGSGIVGFRVSDKSCRQGTSKNVSQMLESELAGGVTLSEVWAMTLNRRGGDPVENKIIGREEITGREVLGHLLGIAIRSLV